MCHATNIQTRTSRYEWWAAFVVFAALGCLWALATPLYGVPDEESHVLRAASVARGEWVGVERSGEPEYYRFVEVPGEFVKPGANAFYADSRLYVPCYAFRPSDPASCFGELDGRGGTRRAATDVGVDPPVIYGFVGIPSLVFTSALGLYLMRVASVLLCAGLLASALLSLRQLAPRWLGASSIGFAVTPTALFLAGSVNPNGVETFAAIGAWASFGVLVLGAEQDVDRRVAARAGIAMLVLVSSRSLSLLWLALIVATCLALATRRALQCLVASRVVRWWTLGVCMASALSIAWTLAFDPLHHLLRHGPDPGPVGILTIVKRSLGGTDALYRQMVGTFGWLDTRSPTLTYVAWTVGLGILVVLGAALASRWNALVLLAVVTATVVAPVAIDVSQARRIGLGWQGRWTLPLAVGVPVVAALVTAGSDRARQLERTRLHTVLAALFVLGQFLAFAQHLRRNAVGADGPLDFWLESAWSPPLPTLVLLVASLAMLVVAAWLLWGRVPKRFA